MAACTRDNIQIAKDWVIAQLEGGHAIEKAPIIANYICHIVTTPTRTFNERYVSILGGPLT